MNFWAWAVFLVATAYTIWDGVRRTLGARNLEDFFAAGRSIPWWAAGLSVMATQLSAITIISGAGMGYENGLEWVQFYFALPFAMVLLCAFFVPTYRRHPILTAYEFLERRFGPGTRSLTSLAFLMSRCLAFAIVLYAPAVVFSVMTGLPIAVTVIATGLLTTAYTMIGGVGAVVWTDVKQMLVIVLGIFGCLGFLAWSALQDMSPGGVVHALGAAGRMNAVKIWDAAWTFAPVGNGAPAAGSFWAEKYNLWTGTLGTLFLFLSYFGCDQSQVQSILTARSTDASRSALLLSAFTKVPLQLLVLFTGALLFLFCALHGEPLLFDPSKAKVELEAGERARLTAVQERHTAAAQERRAAMLDIARASGRPQDDPALVRRFQAATAEAAAQRAAALGIVHEARNRDALRRGDPIGPPEKDTNYIFPHYIFHELPGPILGLIIAAIFAAAISSAAGALSSLTSATMVDFYQRWITPGANQTQALRASRIAMAFWGVAATFASLWLGGGPLLEQVNEVGSWFYGSILGVFVLALVLPRASGVAASCGLLGGFAAVLATHWTWNVAFLWYNLVGCAGCVATGWIAMRLGATRPA